MRARLLFAGLVALAPLSVACRHETAITETVAQVDPLRAGVFVEGPRAGAVSSLTRLSPGAVVRTDGQGRALVRLDHGEVLLLDHDARVRVGDGRRVSLEAGRAWITGTSGGETGTLEVGDAALRLQDARASVVREGPGATVDVVRGEVAFDLGPHRGAVRAGERGVLRTDRATVAPRPLFDDWTGGLADDLAPDGSSAGGAAGLGAVAARRPDEHGAPRWPMLLQRLDARVTVLGDLAVTELEQSFFNPAADTVEGLYTLTVPRGAVLQRFAVDRRGRLVDGVVQERAAAAAAYQAQVYRGSPFDPALLEWDAPGTYHARLFPLQPASTRRIVVTYTQWLPTRADGTRTYRLPLAGLHTRVGELRAHIDLERAGATEVRASAGALRSDHFVTLAQSDVIPTSDLVLELRATALPEASLVRSQSPDDAAGRARTGASLDRAGYVRVAVQAPFPEAREARDEGVDLVLLVDRSAATDPAAMQLQQATAEALVRALSPRDRVLVLAGDVSTRPAGQTQARLQPATPEARRLALDALSRDRRGGATDLGAMLDAAHGALDPQRNGAIVYLGDGVATVGEAELPALRARLARMTPRPRLYAVAVGEAPRLDVLSGITQPAGYAVRIVRRGDVARTALELVAHAARPLVRDFRVDLGPTIERVYPSEGVDLPAGEPLVVLGRISGPSPRTATVRATFQGREISRTVALVGRLIEDRNDLRYRWATARLDHLLARGEPRMVVVELGTRYGLITPYTSLFVPGEDQFPALSQRLPTRPAEPFSVFDLLPLVGCSRSMEPASGSAPASAVEAVPQADEAQRNSQTVATSPARPTAASAPQFARARRSVAAQTPEAPGGTTETPSAAPQPSPDPESAAVAAEEPAPADMPAAPPPVVAAMPSTGAPMPPPQAQNQAVEQGLGATGWSGAGAAVGGGGSGGQVAGIMGHGAPRRSARYAIRGPATGTRERTGDNRDRFGDLDTNREGDDLSNARGRVDGTETVNGAEVVDALRAENERGNRDQGGIVREAGARVLLRCSDAAAVSLPERIPLWRERVSVRSSPSGSVAIWREARARCELPAWADRVALLRVITAQIRDTDSQLELYRRMPDPGAKAWVRDLLLRNLARSGELGRAASLNLLRLDNTTLTAALAQATTPAARLNVLRALVRRFGDDLDLALLLLDAAVTADDRPEVRRTATRLRNDPRTDARVRTAVGEALLSIGDEAEARRTFSEIVEFAPDDPFARRRLGDIALAHGWADEAYRQYQTLAAQLADAPEILLRLAAAARGAGRLDEALRLAERVVTQAEPGAQGTITEAAAAWIALELALAGSEPSVSRDTLSALRARWRRSPAARSAGALRVALRWSHPDDDAELWITLPDEPARRADLVASTFPLEAVTLLEAPARFGVEVRRGGGARPRGQAELVVLWDEGRPTERVVRHPLRFDPDHAVFRFDAVGTTLTAQTTAPAATAAATTTAGVTR